MGITFLFTIPAVNWKYKVKVLIAHPGTQYSHHLVMQLHKAGVLYKFYTCLAISSQSFTGKLLKKLPSFLYNKISNRIIDGVPSIKIKSLPLLELFTFNTKPNTVQQDKKIHLRNKKFQELIPDSELMDADVIIGFDTSSWILADRCKKLGKKFILDVSIGHPVSKDNIYSKLATDYPEWKEQIIPKDSLHIEQEATEMELADKIIVPGNFVKETLLENGVGENKIAVNQFGTLTDKFRTDLTNKKANSKVRFLFMGALTARKGLPFLLKAWSELQPKNAELIIAGYGEIPENVILPKHVSNKGTVPKDERINLFSAVDVFVFPSFFEGLAQVQIEAMAAGLPVIGTKNSGAEDIVDHKVNGYIIETGNSEQLKNAINYFIENADLISKMGSAAQEKATSFSWNNYGERWKKILSLFTEN